MIPFRHRNNLGVIPTFLLELISKRNAIKSHLKTVTDRVERIRLTKQEKAMKTTSNSIYGLMGAKTSMFYDVLCAAAVTSVGKYIILATKVVIQ